MLESEFLCTTSDITDTIWHRIQGKSYKDNCTVSLACLRYIQLSHYGFDGLIHTGELIVNTSIEDEIICIFKELFAMQYCIEKLRLVDDYDADDLLSMADNNSSCFNYRTIEGSDKLSNHSKGLAIDINPLYNPYVRTIHGSISILPGNGVPYADRSLDCPYYIHKGDACYRIFKKYGFSWGGEWTTSKDYQHFEVNL